MQSGEDSTPPVPKTKTVKTPLLTPCRRMGLARNYSGNRSVSKSSLTVETPEGRCEKGCLKLLAEESVGEQVTPKRSRTELIRNPHYPKIRKTSPFSPGAGGSTLHSKFKVPVINSFNSPVKVPEFDTQSENASLAGFEPFEEDMPSDVITKSMVENVKARVIKKEEKLKALKLSQQYKKHDNVTLQILIEKWREGCQNALRELQSLLSQQGHQVPMEGLLNELCVPHELVKYKVDVDDFDEK